MTVRIGLIGAGRMGQVFAAHLANSIAEAHFVAVADIDAARAAEVAGRVGNLASYGQYADLLARQDLDAVVIASATHSHVEVVKAAAAAGKHIFCEKPFALSLAGCDQAVTAAAAGEGQL